MGTSHSDERAMTQWEWARRTGYDPATRTYDESSKPTAAAVPGAHANQRRNTRARKVA